MRRREAVSILSFQVPGSGSRFLPSVPELCGGLEKAVANLGSQVLWSFSQSGFGTM